MKSVPTLMLVTQKGNKALASYLHFLETCIQHGVDAIQLREKNMNPTDLLQFGRALKKLTLAHHIKLIVNDSIKLCLALDADGVHLGQKDESAKRARKILGPEKLVGLSVETLAHIDKANALDIDYIGVGTIFPTENKSNVATTWAIDGLMKALEASLRPVIAIGGINEENCASVIKTGVHGIAAIGAFHDSKQPALTTQNLVNTLRSVHA